MDRYTFRAWLKEYKIMVDVARLNYDGSIEAALSADDDLSEFAPGEFELMQATGLLASKSYRGESEEERMIFEGDICKDSLGWIFSVVWDNECSRFIGKHDKPRGDTYICYIGREPTPVEIIGNRWGTPQLLGSEEE